MGKLGGDSGKPAEEEEEKEKTSEGACGKPAEEEEEEGRGKTRENHGSPEGYGKTTEVRGRRKTTEAQMRFPGPGKRIRTWEGYGKSSKNGEAEEKREKTSKVQMRFSIGKTHLGSGRLREDYAKPAEKEEEEGKTPRGPNTHVDLGRLREELREDFRVRRKTTGVQMRFPVSGRGKARANHGDPDNHHYASLACQAGSNGTLEMC